MAVASANGHLAQTVYRADWVLPITAPPIADGVVVVSGSAIAFVGAHAALPPEYSTATTVELGCAALMPGLVNTHTHLELTALRGFLEGLPFGEWLVTLTRARADCLDADALFDSSCAGIEEALRNGITTCADTTESGVPLRAMRSMGVRGIGYLEVFGPDPAQCTDAITALAARAARERTLDTPLVQTGLSPHAPYTVSALLFHAVAAMARSESWPVAVHVAESAAETQFVRDGDGPFAAALGRRGIAVSPQARSPIALLDACGLLACQPLLIHAIEIDRQDIDLIAAHGARVAHCPISNMKLGHGMQPLMALRAAGIAVGLGSDSVASNDRMDLLGEARQAALVQASLTRTPDVLSAHDVLTMSTLGGAEALQLGHRIGSLTVGKDADLAAFALDGPDVQPVHDPAVTLVHVMAGAAPAILAVVAGVERVRNGIVVGTDLARHARMRQLGDRLRTWRQWRQP